MLDEKSRCKTPKKKYFGEYFRVMHEHREGGKGFLKGYTTPGAQDFPKMLTIFGQHLKTSNFSNVLLLLIIIID